MIQNKLRKGLAITVILIFFGLIFIPNIQGNFIKKENSNNELINMFSPGEFIIKLKKDSNIQSVPLELFNEKHNIISIKKIFKNFENSILNNIYVLKAPKNSDILSIINDYSSCPEVEYAEPNHFFYLDSIPNDFNFSNQWALLNTGQAGGAPGIDIDATEAWNIETGNDNVVVAVIDTGVDYYHPDLGGNIWMNKDEIPGNGIDDDNNDYIDDVRGWDFIGPSPLVPIPDNDPLDDNGHGTHCVGIVGAVTNNEIGVAGVTWNSEIMTIRVGGGSLGVINIISAVKGIEYAVDNGADIISLSFGSHDYSETLESVINYAYSHGVVIFASAGNGNTYQSYYPAAYDNVIAVAATNINDKRTGFSNFGSWIDVSAPGLNIFSTMPTYYVLMNSEGYSKNYDYCDGTSMSCPIVAGIAALLLSYDPTLSNDDIISLIFHSTDWIKTDRYIGNGRVNARKALQIASGVTVPPNKPDKPIGPEYGKTGTDYPFSFKTTDLDGGDLFYLISWNDGTFDEWIGPYPSGTTGLISHKWTYPGKYNVKVKARDTYGVESSWSDSLLVTISGNSKIFNNLNLQRYPFFLQKLGFLLQNICR